MLVFRAVESEMILVTRACYKTWAFNKYNAIAARYAHLRVLTSETTHAEVVAEDLGEILL